MIEWCKLSQQVEELGVRLLECRMHAIFDFLLMICALN